MIIRPARIEDVEAVYSLVQDTVKHMVEQSIHQWDEVYPDKAILTQDIERREMHVVQHNGRAVGIITINGDQPHEYAGIPWTYGGQALVVHRLTIAPAYQRRGLATRLMDLAEDTAMARHCDCLRLDAFIENPAAFTFYEKRGYKKAGIARFRKGDFYCYEKAIRARSPAESPTSGAGTIPCPGPAGGPRFRH